MQEPKTSIRVEDIERIAVEDIQPETTNGQVTGYIRVIRIQTGQTTMHLYLEANQIGKIELVKAVERYEPPVLEKPVDWVKPDREEEIDPDDEPF